LRADLKPLLFGLAIGTASVGPAMAAEQLVMPFSCRIAGGQVSLAPAAPQTSPIYGRAEHKRLTTCSPYDPRKCHNWSVHRFDLDCGGVRTSWQSVVAALTPMLADSVGTAAADDQGYDAYGPPGRAGSYRSGPGGGTVFPRGFAPNPMKVARFTGASPAVADMPLPPKKPEAPAPSEVADVAEIAPSPEIVAPEPPVPDLTIPEPAAMPSMPSMPSVESKAEAVSETTQKPIEVAEQQALNIEVDPAVTGALPKSSESAALWQDASTVWMWTLAILFALTATLLLGRQRIMARLPMPAAFLQLRGPAKLPAVRTSDPEPDTERYTEAVRQKEATASRLRLWDEDWLPRTMLEALDVLGVDPDASRDKMKTTVTRLRRALHPDHAIDDEDRSLRERRLKQINVAWEIVAGKRRVPWLKQSG